MPGTHGGAAEIGSGLMSNATSSMGPTFTSWDSYEVTLLFKGWQTENSWQFALTWFVVVMATMSLHYFECAYLSMKSSMMQVLAKHSAELAEMDSSPPITPDKFTRSTRPFGWQITKLCMGLLSAMRYAMTLFLMLTAMTYNPSLFLALVVGFFIGDFMCCDFHVNMRMGVDNTPSGGRMGPFIRSLICMKEIQLEDDFIPLIQNVDVITGHSSVGLD